MMRNLYAVEIDRSAGTAYVYLEPPSAGSSKSQVNVGDIVVFDIGADGRLVGFEILDPSVAAGFAADEAVRNLERAKIPVSVIG